MSVTFYKNFYRDYYPLYPVSMATQLPRYSMFFKIKAAPAEMFHPMSISGFYITVFMA